MPRAIPRLAAICHVLECVAVLLMVLAGCVAPDAVATPIPTVTILPTSEPAATPTVRPRPRPSESEPGFSGRIHCKGAIQCAAAINAPADLARVRIEPPTVDGCVPCNKLPLAYLNRGVPISEVAQPLADGSWIWLTVEDLLCFYVFDAGEFKPSSVTQW